MMNVVCLCESTCARALAQYRWPPDNIKPRSNGTQPVSMTDPWVLLIHCLIDNLCSRPCMGPFM